MAKKSVVEREKNRQRLVRKYSKKRTTIKELLRSCESCEESLRLYGRLQSLPRNACPSRLRHRCWVTGRSRGYYRYFGVSRHVLREMAHDCLLPGVKKASW
uniref:Small ribosomal subunit protein uS14c n=1 Tax=Cryptomonas sp. CCAC 1634B TaxID=2051848 RepID=A0A679CAC8_9CRYP|nr:ribosomal protein S14 [Cryptomonas sp. CCAC 1634B]